MASMDYENENGGRYEGKYLYTNKITYPLIISDVFLRRR